MKDKLATHWKAAGVLSFDMRVEAVPLELIDDTDLKR